MLGSWGSSPIAVKSWGARPLPSLLCRVTASCSACQGHACLGDGLLSPGSQLRAQGHAAHVSLVTCRGCQPGHRGTQTPLCGLKRWGPRVSEAPGPLEQGQRELGAGLGTFSGFTLSLEGHRQKQGRSFPFSRELQLGTDTLKEFCEVSSFPDVASQPGAGKSTPGITPGSARRAAGALAPPLGRRFSVSRAPGNAQEQV